MQDRLVQLEVALSRNRDPVIQQIHAPPAPRGPDAAPPKSFTGNRSDLRNFLSQVKMVFQLQPSRFQTERQKVIYTATYLQGAAATWFEPYPHAVPAPAMLDNFALFESSICSVFGDPDQAATAERQIRKLTQRGPASSYAAEFQRIAAYLDWNDSALCSQFYFGLQESIKDELCRDERPISLTPLMQLAIRIDTRLYERQVERQRATSRFPSSNTKPAPRPLPVAPPNNFITAPKPDPDAMKIDAISRNRGPLSPQERQRRIQSNLCMYCGKPGHFAIQCPERPQNRIAALNYSTPVADISSADLIDMGNAPAQN